MTSTDVLRTLEFRHAGEQSLLQYQRLVDAKDLDGLAAMVTDDVLIRRQSSEQRGREHFLALYRRFAESDVVRAQHMASNIGVAELEPAADEVRLQVDSTFLAITTHRSGEARQMWGRYRDDVVLRDGRWLLAAKRIDLVGTAFVEESALASTSVDSFGPRTAWSTDT